MNIDLQVFYGAAGRHKQQITAHRPSRNFHVLQSFSRTFGGAKIILSFTPQSCYIRAPKHHETHVSDKHHASVRYEIKKRLNFPMLFKAAAHIVTVSLILE